MSNGVQALLWLSVPVIAWLLTARTREVGVPVAVVLLLGLGAGVAVVATGVLTRGRLELGIGYAVAAAILVVAAWMSQEEQAASAANSAARNALHVLAFAAVGCQVVVAAWAALGILFMSASADMVAADEMPDLGTGFTPAREDDASCGSGSCYRIRAYAVAPEVPEDDVAELVRGSECRPNGWLLDRRERCVEYRLSGRKLTVTVSLADRLQ